jgi:hypothetical protein
MINDNVLTSQITSIRRFTDRIPFSKLTGLAPASVKSARGDAFAIKSNELIFGWIASPDADEAGDRITVSSIRNGTYKLRIFHTWRGTFIEDKEISCTGESVTFGVPYMRITGSQASYIGEDLAFILERLPDPAPLPENSKKSKK